jgi:hypothetical protein
MDLSRIGVVLGINGALKPLVIITTAIVADRLRKVMRTVHVRKLITSISFVPQGGSATRSSRLHSKIG